MVAEADPADPNPNFSPAAHDIVIPAEDELPAVCRDQQLRKAWADKRLQMQGVATLDWLPVIEGEAEIRLRDREEVASRLHALALIAGKAERMLDGDSPSDVQEFVETTLSQRDVRAQLSPEERSFFDNPAPAADEVQRLVWRWEAAYVLAWALKLVDEPLGPPTDYCDPAVVEDTIYGDGNVAGLELRSANDILNQADLAYRYHWAALNRMPETMELNAGIAAERQQALNWLICAEDADWDDVPIDT